MFITFSNISVYNLQKMFVWRKKMFHTIKNLCDILKKTSSDLKKCLWHFVKIKECKQSSHWLKNVNFHVYAILKKDGAYNYPENVCQHFKNV